MLSWEVENLDILDKEWGGGVVGERGVLCDRAESRS